jgi:hypothetical protein
LLDRTHLSTRCIASLVPRHPGGYMALDEAFKVVAELLMQFLIDLTSSEE